MQTVRTVILWFHLLSVIIWIGGQFFYSVVLFPLLHRLKSSPQQFSHDVSAILARFQRFSLEIIGVVVVSGVFNLLAGGLAIEFNYSANYVQLLLLKIGMVVAIAVLQFYQHLGLAPRLKAAAEESESALKAVYRRLVASGAVSFILAAGVVYIGLTLRYV